MKTIRVALTALVLLAILGSSAPCEQVWQEQKLTSWPAFAGTPQVWEDTVYWRDDRTYEQGYDEIRSWDPSNGERVLAQVPLYTSLQAVYGNTLVLREYVDSSNRDLYLWDPVNGKTALCTAPGDQRNVDLYGQTAVWEDYRDGIPQIHIWDPVNGDRALSPSSLTQRNPRIYGDTVVWEDYRNGRADIYMWNPTDGERQLSTYIYPMWKPAIHGDRVLMWAPYDPDFDFGEAGLWEWTASSGLRLLWGLNITSAPTYFDVWGDLVILSDTTAGSNIFSWDPVHGFSQVNQSAQNRAGASCVYQNKVTWIGGLDVYLSTLVVPEPSSLLALGSGCTGLVVLLRRRTRAQ